MAQPLPEDVTVVDPVIRHGRYLAVGTVCPGQLVPRWHVWDATGPYIGYCTDPALVPLVIARHQANPGR
ncbi:hypothetical protein [Streptomyces sp. 7N604]|uniref:hypothetical protein n=1 Tax=Streptomyces sp. 7N604 TaxID=3457415 RepID=UPI003FD4C82E